MPASTLKENLNSSLFETMRRLRPKRFPKTINVYVESDKDISFWRNILNAYSHETAQFDIQLPSKTDLSKGKAQALERNKDMFNLSLGTYLIICIDSDYDYLLQKHTPQSTMINESDYIFQTYAYSTENLTSFSESLHLVCVQSVNCDRKKIDFVELLKLYSNMTYDLFLWSVAFEFINNNSAFPLRKFRQTVGLSGNVNIQEQGKTHLEKLNMEINEAVNGLKQSYPAMISQIETLKTTLAQLGLSKDNAYLFIQGHALEDGFVLPFLKSVCKVLQSEMEKEIRGKAVHEAQKEVELNHYRNNLVEIEKVLRNNTEFKNCFLFGKIKADLDRYFANLA